MTADKGRRYLPDILDHPNSRNSFPSHDEILYIYNITHLDTACSGAVTSIRYCYKYNIATDVSASQVELAMDWTVLIFKEENDHLVVVNTYRIRSRPHRTCTGKSGSQSGICCDEMSVDKLELPETGFIFGITKTSTDSSNIATLLTYHSSLRKYEVDTILMARPPSLGSFIPLSDLPIPDGRGLHCLWFITGI